MASSVLPTLNVSLQVHSIFKEEIDQQFSQDSNTICLRYKTSNVLCVWDHLLSF